MEGMGEGKFYFPFLTLGRSVTDCRLKVRIRFWVMFKLRISQEGGGDSIVFELRSLTHS